MKIHYGINVFRQTVSSEFGLYVVTELPRGIPLPIYTPAVSHRVSRPRWARGRKRLLVGHWLYVVFRTRGRCTLDRKDGRQIVRRLSGGNLQYCIQEPALCDCGSMVEGSVFIKEENVIGGSGWKRQRLHVAGHS